jgi:hypothetical protein
MERLRTHLTFANVASALALFIALGGTAWGVARNSVGSKQIRNKQVRKVDLHRNAVTFPKVANNAIGSKEVRADSITGGDINEGTLDNTIQRSLSNVCGAGAAISSISPQGAAACSLIPNSVSLTSLTNQISALTSQLSALCSQLKNNFGALDGATAPVTGTLVAPVGSVAGLLNATLPGLPNSLPACP